MDDEDLFLEGPVELLEYKSKKYDKHIYLFSDIHVKEMNCLLPFQETIHISDFIKEIIRTNSDKILDIFIEVEYAKPGEKEKKERDFYQFGINTTPSYSYIGDIRRTFYDCLQIDKSLCPYTKTRFHYMDIRNRLLDVATSVGRFLDDISEYQKRGSVWETDNLGAKYFLKAFNQVNDISPENPTNVNISFYPLSKITEQLNAIKNPKIVKKIHEFFDKKIEDKFDKAKNMLKWMKNNFKAVTLENFETLAIILLKAFGILMDVYTIARIFRNYKSEEDSAKYIVVYAGLSHIKHIKEFFNTLSEMELINENTSLFTGQDFQCLFVGPNVPFFQND